MKTEKFEVNEWLNNNIRNRLDWYKSAYAAGKYDRTKKQCLHYAAGLIMQDKDADIFLLSL